MRLSAIVVAFGKESLLEECVSRLAAAVGRVDGESELIVVLNHVSAVARERLERRTPLAVTVAGAWERRLGEAASACETEPVEVFGASAALALHRRAMLDAIGGLDASFFAYLEDADLAWRARMAGWRCVLAPRAIALHHHSPT